MDELVKEVEESNKGSGDSEEEETYLEIDEEEYLVLQTILHFDESSLGKE